ncbi:hypothetical protein RchiOBHm_Chr3g0492221 [Rosa chinensis]|uniref:Uncharacterized protein n=1 Tax=Rosa chinensis TaxID=74649 RepID=A0A2P6RGF9_ROSCH|nr:hypothetical protein RchiOBHm_Chr3g0492221 [Rosa chinensis]
MRSMRLPDKGKRKNMRLVRCVSISGQIDEGDEFVDEGQSSHSANFSWTLGDGTGVHYVRKVPLLKLHFLNVLGLFVFFFLTSSGIRIPVSFVMLR